MIQVRRLGHATFSTPDLDRQIEYWRDVVGLTLIDRGPDHAHFATKLGQEAIFLERGSDVRLLRLYEGTTQIQQLIIGRELLRQAS